MTLRIFMPGVLRTATLYLAAVVAGVTLAGCGPLSLGRGTSASVPARVDTVPARPPWIAPVAEAAARSDDAGLKRLVQLAELWTAARWFHPEAVGGVGAWDTAYLKHVEIARAAPDDAAFARAVQDMLGELRDAETRVVGDTAGDPRVGAVAVTLQRTGDSLIMARPVHVHVDHTLALGVQLGSTLATAAPRAMAVLDLRADSGQVSGVNWWSRSLVDAEFPLPGGVVEAPARQRVRHTQPGVEASLHLTGAPVSAERASVQRASVERECCTQWLMTSGAVLRVARVGPSALSDRLPTDVAVTEATDPAFDVAIVRHVVAQRDGYAPPPLVVLVNDGTIVPAPLFTLHEAGHAVFVSTGSGLLRSDAHAEYVAIGGGFHARIRMEVLRLANGRAVPTRADTVLSANSTATTLVADSSDRAVQLALSIARGTVRVTKAQHTERVAKASTVGISPVVDAPYPSLPERLLAVTRLWGTVRAFNPYLPMADESWDDMFARALGDAEAASSAREYSSALLRFVATLDASQADIRVRDHPEFGARTGYVPFTLRLVDRRPLVVAISDSATQRTGVRAGDEVLAIGGEPIDKRLGRLRELVSASNEWSRDERLEAWLMAGPAGAIATFRVRSTSGVITDREFAYGASGQSERATVRPVRAIESMANGIVRVRLGEDTASGLTAGGSTRGGSASLASLLQDASAIIVDARGTRDNASLAWLTGSVLDADATAYARDDRSAIVAPPRGALRTPEIDPARQFTRSERTTPVSPRDAFAGPVAVLIDATTSGEGELIALRVLAGGTNRLLVGSQTAGAVGETAVLSLPGSVDVRIPVSDVRYPDGRFIQRLGLSPNVNATPTVDGVRNGRDEVMEAAQRWIMQQLAPPPVRRR